MPAFRDLTGKSFGRWTVIERADNEGKKVMWLCRCECGTTKPVIASSLTVGNSTSCGCYLKSLITKHGATTAGGRTPEYNSWCSMKIRCQNANDAGYARYGGRGITVCERWRNDFVAFLADMGPRPQGCSLDRIDNDGNYEPGNCRWATHVEQAQNKTWNVTSAWKGERDDGGRFTTDATRLYKKALERIIANDEELSCYFCSASEIARMALRGETWLSDDEQLARDLADD